ncbi:tetratricopeptide repeat protein [Pedobacter sp. SL55]|uniref:tetratricopeptide repeat protein n=1 Tax=Pedobacter sp. SL55 TaxID=2995161 RepID=UPI00226E3A63|nr:tetratricopeptide repeat protein [Pedobacter sp. SL55]WAC42186.1 tetratricopeptide repeat protein [Pedobacter sp. SL55]
MKKYSCFILLSLCISINSCVNKKAETKEIGKIKVSRQDSVKLKKYIEQIDVLPLFSTKRQKYLDSFLLILPSNAYAWQQKAMPLFKQKKYEVGMQYLDSAVKYDQTNHYLEYRAFIKCIFQKNYIAAIRDFDAIQKIKGNSYVMDHTYEFYKGLCFLQLNEFNKAEKLFSKNINEDRKKLGEKWINCSALFYQGICFFEMDNYKQAMISFDECLKRYRNFTDAKVLQSNMFRKLWETRRGPIIN